MKKVLLTLLFLALLPLSVAAQNTLTIEITHLKSSEGKIFLEVYDKDENVIKSVITDIVDDACTVVVEGLEDGQYAFRYFHDKNNNQEMDTNGVGIPKEGFGFSNNAKATFGPPKFKKWLFDLTEDTTVSCKPQYM